MRHKLLLLTLLSLGCPAPGAQPDAGSGACRVDSDCEQSQVCDVSGACVFKAGSCTGDTDCPTGESCDVSGSCVPTAIDGGADAGPADTGSDAGHHDAGSPDAGPPDAGPGWWSPTTATAPSGRMSSAMVFDSKRNVAVLLGGDVPDTEVLRDLWEWNGTTWTERTQGSPSERAQHMMAFDSVRGVTVLFGGDDSNDTWEWNGTTWTEVNLCAGTTCTAVPPWPRYVGSMTFDAVRGVTVLFGGLVQEKALNDTWEWNGKVWTQQTPAQSPSVRIGAPLVFDSTRGVSVLFGGNPFDGTTPLTDTWEWDGTNWTEKTSLLQPVENPELAMAFDSVRGVTVLVDGNNDTWEWNGSQWTQRLPSTSPADVGQAVMAFDSLRGVTLRFGGQDSHQIFTTTLWEWDGVTH